MEYENGRDEEKIDIEKYLSLRTNDLILVISVFDQNNSLIPNDTDSSLNRVKAVICSQWKFNSSHSLNTIDMVIEIKNIILHSGIDIRMPILLLATTIGKIGIPIFCQCN